jgi:hypothetical protein
MRLDGQHEIQQKLGHQAGLVNEICFFRFFYIFYDACRVLQASKKLFNSLATVLKNKCVTLAYLGLQKTVFFPYKHL